MERFGLQAQMRRAAVSVATNLVEGSARRTTGEFVNFVSIAAGSASEVRYLAGLAARLGFLPAEAGTDVQRRYTVVCAQLEALIQSLRPKT